MTRVYDRDVILELWASGETSAKIAAKIDSTSGYVRTIVKISRENGDERAFRHKATGNAGHLPSRMDHDAVLDRWQAGWAAKEIARFIGSTPKTIYGLLIAYRRRGDPRAVSRKTRRRE